VAGRIKTQTSYKPGFEDWSFHFVLPLAAYAVLVLSAFAAQAYEREALFAEGCVAGLF
jgi:hypothetical protein